MKPGKVYFHLFQVPTHDELSGLWRGLFHSAMIALEESGLGAAFGCDVVMVGDARQRAHITGKDWLTQYGWATLREEWDISENEGWWENRTIQRLWKDCVEHHRDPRVEAFPLLYHHTKGSLTENYCLACWRRYMTYFCVHQWRVCAGDMMAYGFDTCGVDIKPFGGWHYSGNFWWARSDFIASLPDPQERSGWTGEPRMWSEYWLLHTGGGRHLCLHDSGIDDLYRTAYHRRQYAEGDFKPRFMPKVYALHP